MWNRKSIGLYRTDTKSRRNLYLKLLWPALQSQRSKRLQLAFSWIVLFVTHSAVW